MLHIYEVPKTSSVLETNKPSQGNTCMIQVPGQFSLEEFRTSLSGRLVCTHLALDTSTFNLKSDFSHREMYLQYIFKKLIIPINYTGIVDTRPNINQFFNVYLPHSIFFYVLLRSSFSSCINSIFKKRESLFVPISKWGHLKCHKLLFYYKIW